MCPSGYSKPLTLEIRNNPQLVIDYYINIHIYVYIYIYIYIYIYNYYYAHLTSVRFEHSVCHESLLTSLIYIYIYTTGISIMEVFGMQIDDVA